MELVIWLAVVLGVLGIGMGSMVWAYRRPLGNTVLFTTPVTSLSMATGDQAREEFEAGCDAFKLGRYPKAIDRFIQTVALEPTCAEAFHNCGLAYANLGTDGPAVRALVQASDFYNQQGTKAGLDLVKAQMEMLAEQRRGLTKPSTEQASAQTTP